MLPGGTLAGRSGGPVQRNIGLVVGSGPCIGSAARALPFVCMQDASSAPAGGDLFKNVGYARTMHVLWRIFVSHKYCSPYTSVCGTAPGTHAVISCGSRR